MARAGEGGKRAWVGDPIVSPWNLYVNVKRGVVVLRWLHFKVNSDYNLLNRQNVRLPPTPMNFPPLSGRLACFDACGCRAAGPLLPERKSTPSNPYRDPKCNTGI
ncbi:hypothetical protein [Novipirellula artificiosorum]|uniref:hypothetical protein n=1 Tax=Novipirellula artificiosorum TaxID=2528016 RepID=UPI0018CDAB33|nr:hypothetical protein [Novipirellula artificiosorum]